MKSLHFLLCLGVLLAGRAVASESDGKGNPYWGSAKKSIEGALTARRLPSYPKKISDLHPGRPIDVYGIDLDGDARGDFIVHVRGAFRTCFVKSDFSIMGCEKLGDGDGFQYYWFVNIDRDPMLELISLVGDEDYSDYFIYKFDPKTWRMSKRVRIAPVILSKSPAYQGIYWGYPWDITKLVTSKSGGRVRIYSCVAQSTPEMESDTYAGKVLFVAFEGVPTQGDSVGYFNFLEKKFKYVQLDDLKLKYEAVGN